MSSTERERRREQDQKTLRDRVPVQIKPAQ